MQCPLCGRWVPKRGRNRAQWASWNPIAGGWFVCSDCHGAVPVPGDWVLPQLVAAKERLVTIALEAPRHFAGFVVFWMQQLPAGYRKELSHHGLVRRFPGSPVVPSYEGFDAGNLV